MTRRLAIFAAVGLVALAAAGPATAHEGGKAEPRISAGVSRGPGTVRVLTVRVTDVDSGDPVSEATVAVSGEMSRPHAMQTPPWRLAEVSPGIYRARVRFPMPATWSLNVSVTGEEVVTARSQFSAEIQQGAQAAPSTPAPAAGVPDLTTLPTRVEDSLGERDVLTMAFLWLHGLAAMGWIVGVLVMLLALSARPGVVAEALRVRLAAGYRRWGAWVHWGLVPVIVGTGIYNMLYVTPFAFAWRPEQFAALQDVPYGPLYEAVLIVKLGLFAALLVTGTQLLAHTVRSGHEPAFGVRGSDGFLRTLSVALGPAGFFYLGTVPLILAAAMALRYVHILSHVATVLESA